MLSKPRAAAPLFHGGNRGSNPLGDAIISMGFSAVGSGQPYNLAVELPGTRIAQRRRSKNRLADFPVHFAAQIGGDAAQLQVQPVAGAAAGQTEDKFNPRLFQRMMLSNDAAAMPL
jgi:hypothetical protein